MSDFLVSIGNKYCGQDLLSGLKQPYGSRAPDGQCFAFPWGSIAVLNERLANNKNIIIKDKTVFAWVGDLVTDMSDTFTDALIQRLACLKKPGKNSDSSIVTDKVFEKLNGAFAVIAADEFGISVITDPMSFIQIFAAKGRDGQIVSIGTHADLTASISDNSQDLDITSIAQYLIVEYCTFPNTMYANVTELQSGAAHFINLTDINRAAYSYLSYWVPPKEIRSGCSESELTDELLEAFVCSVKERCPQGTTAVAISGGLDSRLVMAAVPDEAQCIGVTLCDKLNRETKTAEKVTKAYGREWFPFFREQDYIANNIADLVKFIGFECGFIHAHLFGFNNQISSKADTLLTGDMLDTLLRAYCASDFISSQKMGGVLAGEYKKTHFDYPNKRDGLPENIFSDNIIKNVNIRWKNFYEKNADQNRGSLAEWLKVYPFRQWVEVATWSAQRRVLPLRLLGADRRLLDFAFKCPIELKLGNKIFFMAAKKIYGKGLHIPSANDGVRPCSGHWSRLIQRAIRKIQDRTAKILTKLGMKPKIQHSWHNYQKYWQESKKLDELRQEYGHNLDRFDGVLFKQRGRDLLENRDTDWHYGFRLLQLAVWLRNKNEYKVSGKHP